MAAERFTTDHQKLIDDLIQRDYEFRKLADEHRKLDESIRRFDGRMKLSDTEELERKRLQKLKLRGKDRMEQILRQHTKSGSRARA